MPIIKPSETQIKALRLMAENDGTIRRYQGGFWMRTGAKFTQHPTMPYQSPDGELYFDVRTIRAMESHGWVERTHEFKEEWRDTRRLTDAGRTLCP